MRVLRLGFETATYLVAFAARKSSHETLQVEYKKWLSKGQAQFMTADWKSAFLLPPLMEGWLNEDHLARTIEEVVQQLDQSSLTRQNAEPAQQQTSQPLFSPSVVKTLPGAI